jgi:hypothetical protein
MLLALHVNLLAQEPAGALKKPSDDGFQVLTSDSGWKWAADAEVEIKELRSKIKTELTTTSEEWAGEYYRGDGRGFNYLLTWAPKSGYVLSNYGCLGLYGWDFGTVTRSGDLFVFHSKLRNSDFDWVESRSGLVEVKWGGRHYLVAPEMLRELMNERDNGFEPRDRIHGDFFLRLGEEKINANGEPSIPLKFRADPAKAHR